MPQGAGYRHHGNGDGQHDQVWGHGQDQKSQRGPDHTTDEDWTPTGLHLVDDGPADEIDRSEPALADAQHEGNLEI